MKPPSDYARYGLTHETRFDPEVAMPFWNEHSTPEFLDVMAHELNNEVTRLNLLIHLLESQGVVLPDALGEHFVRALYSSRDKLRQVAQLCERYDHPCDE